jgi:hypothetical protein
METIAVEYGGRTWNGSFTVEGDEVSVASAYGWKRAPIGRKRPVDVATKALAEIVRRAAKAPRAAPTRH